MVGPTIDALVQHIDIGPTILDLMQKKGNGGLLQGKSLLPLLNDQEV